MKFFVIFFLASPIQARQLSDLRSDARVLSLDTGGTSARFRFTNPQVDAFINECQRDAISQTLPIMRSRSFELSAGTTYYSLASDFITIKRVTWRNQVLSEKTPKALDSSDEWETISGTPQDYFITFSSRTILGIYPWPADSTSTGTVKYEYYAQADTLSADSDQPFNNIREFYSIHHILAYCAAGRMTAIDGMTDLTAIYLQEYRFGLPRLAEIAQARPSYTPAIVPGSGRGSQ